ncbi:hypothetical protein AB1N83_014398 [Pleurotus pulmonarius]
MDLAALEQYTAHAQGLQAKHDQLRERLKTTAPSLRSKLRGKMSKIHPMTTASNTVADRFGKGPWFARRLRGMASYVLRTQELPPSTQGKGAQRSSFFNCSEVRSALEKWVKGLIPTDQGGFEGQMRPTKLRQYVNMVLFPSLEIEDTISESTAARWLKKLGFRLLRVQKGIYVDGHERDDVVESRKQFLDYIYTKVLPFSYTYDGADLTATAPSLL